MKRRLLVVERHHLGDAVLAVPFVRAAMENFHVIIACRPELAEFWQCVCPDVQIVAPADGWGTLRRALPRLGRADAAVCAWPDPRAQWLLCASGAGVRVGFALKAQNFYGAARPWRKRRLRLAQVAVALSGPLLTHALDRRERQQPQRENWTQIARVLGFEPDVRMPWWPVPKPTGAVGEWIESVKAAGRPLWVVHAGGRLPTKRWPLERFQQLLNGYFSRRGVAVLIIQAPGEESPEPRGDWQIRWTPPRLAEFFAVLAAVDGVLCNDSFCAHAAAALGRTVVTIFGSADPAWFAPFGQEFNVVATDVCEARPCVDRCIHRSPICLEAISNHLVEKSLEAVIFPLTNP
ncbi:MAG: glycosyltransferase family 9 protein [Terrimicrobiaceae bacterium]|nr:glycosyltransferase family 9 protein [Terrimicrobiaceae bacterium]